MDKPLIWLHGEIKTPPFSQAARLEAGFLLRKLQRGESLSLPHSRPMPAIGPRCHELRVTDKRKTWRVIYRIDADAKRAPFDGKHAGHLVDRRLRQLGSSPRRVPRPPRLA